MIPNLGYILLTSVIFGKWGFHGTKTKASKKRALVIVVVIVLD